MISAHINEAVKHLQGSQAGITRCIEEMGKVLASADDLLTQAREARKLGLETAGDVNYAVPPKEKLEKRPRRDGIRDTLRDHVFVGTASFTIGLLAGVWVASILLAP